MRTRRGISQDLSSLRAKRVVGTGDKADMGWTSLVWRSPDRSTAHGGTQHQSRGRGDEAAGQKLTLRICSTIRRNCEREPADDQGTGGDGRQGEAAAATRPASATQPAGPTCRTTLQSRRRIPMRI